MIWHRSAGAATGGARPAAGHALRVDIAAQQVDHARREAAAAGGDQHARQPAPLGLTAQRPRPHRPRRSRPRNGRCGAATALHHSSSLADWLVWFNSYNICLLGYDVRAFDDGQVPCRHSSVSSDKLVLPWYAQDLLSLRQAVVRTIALQGGQKCLQRGLP